MNKKNPRQPECDCSCHSDDDQIHSVAYQKNACYIYGCKCKSNKPERTYYISIELVEEESPLKCVAMVRHIIKGKSYRHAKRMYNILIDLLGFNKRKST